MLYNEYVNELLMMVPHGYCARLGKVHWNILCVFSIVYATAVALRHYVFLLSEFLHFCNQHPPGLKDKLN